MQLKTLKSLALASVAFVALSGSAMAAELAKPQTASERYYAKKNIAQDSDNGALPPSENALVPEPDSADALPNPVRTLQAIPVRSRDGKQIGRIEKIDLAGDGHARVLHVAVNGSTVALEADQVLYDAGRHVAFAPYSREAIVAMAGGEGVTASNEPRLY